MTSPAQFSTGGCAANVSRAAQRSVFTFLLPPALGFAATTSASASLSGLVSQLVSHLASPKTAQTFVAAAAIAAEAAAEAAAALGIAMAMASSGFSGHLQQAVADVVDVAVFLSRRDAWLFFMCAKKKKKYKKRKEMSGQCEKGEKTSNEKCLLIVHAHACTAVCVCVFV